MFFIVAYFGTFFYKRYIFVVETALTLPLRQESNIEIPSQELGHCLYH